MTLPIRELTTGQALTLWKSLPGSEPERVIAFAHELMLLCSEPPEELRIRIDELGLSSRARGALKRAGYNYVDQVVGLSDEELLMLRNIGYQALGEIRWALKRFKSGAL